MINCMLEFQADSEFLCKSKFAPQCLTILSSPAAFGTNTLCVAKSTRVCIGVPMHNLLTKYEVKIAEISFRPIHTMKG